MLFFIVQQQKEDGVSLLLSFYFRSERSGFIIRQDKVSHMFLKELVKCLQIIHCKSKKLAFGRSCMLKTK